MTRPFDFNSLPTRLPNVGTTIFTVMSAMATQHGAINLGQGFPDFDCDPALLDAVQAAMRSGRNQYPPMAGVPELRSAVAAQLGARVNADGGRRYTDDEITITAGATQAILTAVLSVVMPGDEVIVLEPCYDSYAPNIETAGGVVVRVPLTPGRFRPDFDAIAAAITPRTRAMIVNTPHNPTGVVWTRTEWEALAELLAPTSIVLISDEVYEHMVYDGRRHLGATHFPSLAERSFVVSSFGKTYHVTGWKVGFVAAPAAMTQAFRRMHQFNVFTVNTPMQLGLASFMAEPEHHRSLAPFYQAKRDRFRAGLARTPLRALPCEGTYFQSVDYREAKALRDLSEAQACIELTTQWGVTAIPTSAFYADGFDQKIIRLCFAKRDETLDLALSRLAKL